MSIVLGQQSTIEVGSMDKKILYWYANQFGSYSQGKKKVPLCQFYGFTYKVIIKNKQKKSSDY